METLICIVRGSYRERPCGSWVIEVCGNIHVRTGACQSAILGIATSWMEELNNSNTREIQCEALWVYVRLDTCADRYVYIHSVQQALY